MRHIYKDTFDENMQNYIPYNNRIVSTTKNSDKMNNDIDQAINYKNDFGQLSK